MPEGIHTVDSNSDLRSPRLVGWGTWGKYPSKNTLQQIFMHHPHVIVRLACLRDTTPIE